MEKKPQDPKGKTEHEPRTQEELNWSKIEKKAFRFKLLELFARLELRIQVLTCSTFM